MALHNTSSQIMASGNPTVFGMRKRLWWLLAVCMGLTALSLVWPVDRLDGNKTLVAPVGYAARAGRVVEDEEGRQVMQRFDVQREGGVSMPLPKQLQVPTFGRHGFDPFVGVAPPAPPGPKAFVGPLMPEPLPPPVVPPANYKYLGQMVDVQGQRVVWISRGEDGMIPVAVGTPLGDGYVVEALAAHAIQLKHTASGTVVQVPIPETNQIR